MYVSSLLVDSNGLTDSTGDCREIILERNNGSGIMVNIHRSVYVFKTIRPWMGFSFLVTDFSKLS